MPAVAAAPVRRDPANCIQGNVLYVSMRGRLSMTRVKEKRIAHCQKCKKQTAWLYINGVKTFWLCLFCATREEAQVQEPPEPSSNKSSPLTNGSVYP